MIIQRVLLSNIDELYEAIAIGKHNPEYGHKPGSNINNLLQRVSITFDIDDITIFELFILKRFTNASVIIPQASFYDNEALGERYTDVIDNMIKLSDIINHDSDIKFNINQYFLTTGCLSKNVTVSLTGTNLFSIFGTMPDLFFMQAFDFQVDSDFTPKINDYKVLEETIINKFVNNFYSYLQSTVNNIDMVTDSYINSNYYSFIDDSETNVSISDVNTPYGSLHLFGDKSKDANETIPKMKELFTDIVDDVRAFPYRATEICFVVNCSFYTFLEMSLALSRNFFIDNQDFKTLFIEDSKMIVPKGLTKYSMRIGTKLNDIRNMVSEVSSSKANNLIRYKFVPLNTCFKFSMKLSLNDISSDILKYRKSVEDGIYGKDSALTNEVLLVLDSIINNSKIIYNLISNSK